VGSISVFCLSVAAIWSAPPLEVWQFKFACCPQVQEISSVAHQLSCFGGGYSLYFFTGGLFLCLSPFLWGKVSDLSASPLLSACCDALLFIFQFCRAISLWVLLTGSLWTTTCLTSGSGLLPTCCWPFCLSSICFLKVCVEISSLLLPPSPVCFQCSCPPLLCTSFQFLVYSVFFFFLWGCGVSLPRGLCWFIPRVAVGILCDAWCSPVWSGECLPCRFGAGVSWLQQHSCFLSVTWHCRRILWARGSGCQGFDSPWCFISAKCGSSISARFLIHGAHAVCFCTLVSILDPLW
jgi:hypothetical protein